jgi:hypothetical protein
VSLNIDAQEIVVSVEHPRGTKFCCPECQLELPCYDHAEERRWRHLDSCQFKTLLSASVPRVKCPEHGVRGHKNGTGLIIDCSRQASQYQSMSRTARVAPGGMLFHVLNRGVGRMRLFLKEGDFAAFERVIAKTLLTRPMRIVSYCLMSNHWHMVLWPEREGDLAAFMQKLTITHVRNWQENRVLPVSVPESRARIC